MFAVRILLAVPLAAIATVAAAAEPLYLQPRLIEAFRAPAPNLLAAEYSAGRFASLSVPDPLIVETFAATDDALFEFVATPAPIVGPHSQTTSSVELMSFAATRSEFDLHPFPPVDWSQTSASTLLEQPTLNLLR